MLAVCAVVDIVEYDPRLIFQSKSFILVSHRCTLSARRLKIASIKRLKPACRYRTAGCALSLIQLFGTSVPYNIGTIVPSTVTPTESSVMYYLWHLDFWRFKDDAYLWCGNSVTVCYQRRHQSRDQESVLTAYRIPRNAFYLPCFLLFQMQLLKFRECE
jgi:hypothetical protein